MVIQLAGAQAAVCSTAIGLCRESERKAWFNERKHGPPALLVDYLSRWFGQSAGRLLRDRQRGTKRGHDDGEVKRPKSADPPLSVEGPELGPLPEDKAENQETREALVDAEAADMASSSEETELPSAETLPLFVGMPQAHPPDECDEKEEDKPQAPSPAGTSDEEEPSPVEVAASLAEVLPSAEADDAAKPDMVDMVSDSDSDYYRPGPHEDPLWTKRQEILKKLKGLA